jgi:phytoene/squalene synthetase
MKWKPRDIAFAYRASQPSVLRVHQFDYPGFRAFLDGREADVSRDADTGEVLLDLPPAAGTVTLRLTELVPEKAGRALSLMSAAFALLLLLTTLRRRAGNMAAADGT